MVSLYTKNDKYYLLTTCGTYYNIAVEFGNTNNQIISNEFLSTCREIPFNLDEISNILILFKKLQTPIKYSYMKYISPHSTDLFFYIHLITMVYVYVYINMVWEVAQTELYHSNLQS